MRIGVIGCGWLGLPLAERLVHEGHIVFGTTMSYEKIQLLKDKGITPFLVELNEEHVSDVFNDMLKEIDVLVVNIPPGLRKNPKSNFIKKIKLLINYIEKSELTKVLFVSSTSVYGGNQGLVNEDISPIPNTESGRQLVECENMFISNNGFKTAIIRFAGLIGNDRHPINFLSGREGIKGGNDYINLIRLEDCIDLILKILRTDRFPFVLNGVFPSSLTKKEYYTKIAQQRNMELPCFMDDSRKIHRKKIETKYLEYQGVFSICK
ncbi:epimerase [Neptunitalea chrysea]|uniref:Epimerase n=1 Tax=Neptunitalea chrysea TaxID=1647581 RepID=A0A9W6ETR3_9FLAO|nr:NAD(P)-binding domain-containing protein [Neptunitalea chrysea]GLB51484.1 epimerase [Neptunitalea chrysea]